jgi:hypothetical protein
MAQLKKEIKGQATIGEDGKNQKTQYLASRNGAIRTGDFIYTASIRLSSGKNN